MLSNATVAEVALSVSNANFGNVQVGTSLIVPVTATNTGKSNLTISQVIVSGSGFSFSGPNMPITVGARKSVSLSVAFAPQTAGTFSGSLTVSFLSTWGRHNTVHSATGTLSATAYTTTSSPGYLTAPSSMNLGSVTVGGSQTQVLSVSNSGGSSLTISGVSVSGSSFSASGISFPYALAAGGTASLSVTFAPNTSGTSSGVLTISSNASNPSVGVSLTGSATNPIGTLQVTPGSMSFGSVTIGSTQTQSGSVTASGGSVTLSSASSSNPAFSFGGLTLPVTLAAGQSLPFNVAFAPTTTGTSSGTLTIGSNASNPSVGVSLTGSGTSATGTLQVTPGSMSFGSVTIGSAQTQSGSVTASGGSVTLSSASSTNSAFSLGGLALPITLAAGQSLPFNATFTPTVAGSVSANISFFTSTSTSVLETASGSGVTIQHAVDLSWNGSTSTSVAGYNVYRGNTATGPYSKINSTLDPLLNYNDGTVQSGQTYYYVTTAVDSTGVESSYSNQVQVVVPFP